MAHVAANLDHYEVLRRLAEGKAQANEERAKAIEDWAKAINERAKATKEKATTEGYRRLGQGYQWKATLDIARAVEEYKDSDAFMADDIDAAIGIYMVRFSDYKVKVIEDFLKLNLHRITMLGEVEEEESAEEDGVARGQVVEGGGANEDAIGVPMATIVAVKVPKEMTILVEVQVAEEATVLIDVPQEIAALTEVPEEPATSSKV